MYYNKTGDANSTDYLVDHSIIHYLIDPDGEFVTFYGAGARNGWHRDHAAVCMGATELRGSEVEGKGQG